MSLDQKKWLEQLDNYPEAKKCIRQAETLSNVLPSYEFLYSLKSQIPKELYAYYLRTLLQYNTANVPVELRLLMLQDVDRNDIMYQEELDAIDNFETSVVIYRGTSKSEIAPGLSWSLRRYIAESSDFYNGRLFIAQISPSSILLYLSKDGDEEEIIAHVTDNYYIIDD